MTKPVDAMVDLRSIVPHRKARQESDMFYLPPNFWHGKSAAAVLHAMRPPEACGPMSVRDLAILGEAAVILGRLQCDGTLETRAGELAGLGRAIIQLVLDGTIEQSGAIDPSL